MKQYRPYDTSIQKELREAMTASHKKTAFLIRQIATAERIALMQGIVRMPLGTMPQRDMAVKRAWKGCT